MRAGRLRHRVVIQTATEAQDTAGEAIKTWTDAMTTWASVEPLSGRELLRAQEVNAESTIRVRMRYNTHVSQTARLLVDSTRILDINSVINTREIGRELELLCSETA